MSTHGRSYHTTAPSRYHERPSPPPHRRWRLAAISTGKLPTFVVVGGGFKGAFIAANLVQPGRNRVLLLERNDVLVRLSGYS